MQGEEPMARVGAGAPAYGQVSAALWVAIGSCHILGMGHSRSCSMHLRALCHHAAATPFACQPCGVDLTIPGQGMAKAQWQDGQTSVPAMGTWPSPAGHCLSQGCQDCTYQLGQRAWARVSHAGSTMALLPLSTAIQDARFILAIGVRERRHMPGLSTSPAVGSSGHIGWDGSFWASKSPWVP